jgi:outer membrane receptor protein involved in Fe transport
MRRALFVAFCLVAATLEAGQANRVSGVVVDASGAPVPDASVTAGTTAITTEDDGTFELTNVATGTLLVAIAPGFAAASMPVNASTDAARLVLYPAPLTDRIVVTASRGGDRVSTPASTTVVTSAELLNSAAGALDDVLRSTPGFSLFRRTSSRVANPTTQGVTLRGVSGSGASRTLVLADGLPLNDPFGSWVYWNRVPLAAIERVEVVRGATGDLYGADALGGVVQVLTFEPTRTRLRATVEGGSLGTGRFSAFGSTRQDAWSAEGAGEFLRTNGYHTTPESLRGPADAKSDSDYGSGFLGGGYTTGYWHANARVSFFSEERGNGTNLQENTTDWKQLSGEAGGTLGTGAWQAHGAGGTQDYFQTFSAVFDQGGIPRAGERLVRDQTTETSFFNAAGQWAGGVSDLQILLGAEARRADATLEEFVHLPNDVVIGPNFLGGVETVGSLFGRLSLMPRDDVTVVFGARGDFWSSEPLDDMLPAHEANFLSPRLSVAWSATETASVQASVYRAYRTPTLNELHRGFRVGDIVTNANPLLDPERLTGVEGGILFAVPYGSFRVTAFTNELADAVANVTINVTPTLITRERQNTNSVRASGIEIEADIRPDPLWTVGAVLVVTRSTFDSSPAQPEIEGNRIPQVPTFQVGGQVVYADPSGLTGALQARIVGAQFDDDLNQAELGAFGVVDLTLSQEFQRGVTGFIAVENLFDKDYLVATSPDNIGWPRTVRVGVRLFLP